MARLSWEFDEIGLSVTASLIVRYGELEKRQGNIGETYRLSFYNRLFNLSEQRSPAIIMGDINTMRCL